MSFQGSSTPIYTQFIGFIDYSPSGMIVVIGSAVRLYLRYKRKVYVTHSLSAAD